MLGSAMKYFHDIHEGGGHEEKGGHLCTAVYKKILLYLTEVACLRFFYNAVIIL